jgi:hypothetical protein
LNDEAVTKAVVSLEVLRDMVQKYPEPEKLPKTPLFRKFLKLDIIVSLNDKTIIGGINSLIKQPNFKKLPNSIQEAISNAAKAIAQVKQQSSDTKSASQTFQILVGNKNRAQYLLCGDRVGCCIATEKLFSSMIDRTVYIDQLTLQACPIKDGKTYPDPCALAWLFLASDEKGDLCLVANFFELDAQYSNPPELRKGLLHSLVNGCKDLAKHLGVKHLFLRPTLYGMFGGMLDNYDGGLRLDKADYPNLSLLDNARSGEEVREIPEVVEGDQGPRLFLDALSESHLLEVPLLDP